MDTTSILFGNYSDYPMPEVVLNAVKQNMGSVF